MKRKISRLVMALALVVAFAGAFAIKVHDAPLALAACNQTTWIETGLSSSASGAHTSVTAYLQKLVDSTDHATYCGSVRTRLHWEFDYPNVCGSFWSATRGQYGSGGPYGVVYTSYMCSGNIMGQPSGNLYSGAHATTCGTVDGGQNDLDNYTVGASGGCF